MLWLAFVAHDANIVTAVVGDGACQESLTS